MSAHVAGDEPGRTPRPVDHTAVEQGEAAARRHAEAAAHWYDVGDRRRADAEARQARLARRTAERLRVGLPASPPA